MSENRQGEVTIANIEDFIGKQIDCKRRMWHHYPLTFIKINDNYYYVDRNAVMMPFHNKDTIRYDNVKNAPRRKPKDKDAR